jgi:hypothetical protein
MLRSREDGGRPERDGDVTRGCRNRPETLAGVRGSDVKFRRFEMVSARGKKKGRGRSVGAFYRRPRYGEGVRVWRRGDGRLGETPGSSGTPGRRKGKTDEWVPLVSEGKGEEGVPVRLWPLLGRGPFRWLGRNGPRWPFSIFLIFFSLFYYF